MQNSSKEQREKARLTKHPHVLALHYAIRNITATVNRIETFDNIPRRVARLQKALDSNPASLKVVYLEAGDLSDWRDELIEEVKGQGDRLRSEKMGTSAPQNPDLGPTLSHSNSSSYKGYSQSPEVYQKIIEVLGGHFSVVLNLCQIVREKVKEHVGNCIDLGVESPALVVRACEVLLLIEESNKKKFNKMSEDEKDMLGFGLGPNAFKNEVIEHLKDSFDIRIQQRYATYMFQAADEGKTGMEATLGAATKGMLDMILIKTEIARCFPPDFKVLEVYRERFEQYMTPQVAALYSQNVANIEIGDLLKLTNWLEQYNTLILSNGAGVPCEEFVNAVSALMDDYVTRMTAQTAEWFRNIEDRPVEVVQDHEGRLVTRGPEDMINVINMQIEVARETLPPHLAFRAIHACVLELKKAQDRMKANVEAHWLEWAIENICATVNDAFRFQDVVETLISKLDPKDPALDVAPPSGVRHQIIQGWYFKDD